MIVFVCAVDPIKTELEQTGDDVTDGKETVTKSVIRALLEDVVNGNKILSQSLDALVTTTHQNPDSKLFGIKINFEGLINKDSSNQCSFLLDTFYTANVRTFSEEKFPIVTHPAIAVFIWMKWAKAIYFFYFNALLYFTFLISYTLMVINIYHSSATEATDGANGTESCLELQEDTVQYSTVAHRAFLILSVLILMVWEIVQIVRLKRLYLKEIENFFEWFVFLTAILLSADIVSSKITTSHQSYQIL